MPRVFADATKAQGEQDLYENGLLGHLWPAAIRHCCFGHMHALGSAQVSKVSKNGMEAISDAQCNGATNEEE